MTAAMPWIGSVGRHANSYALQILLQMILTEYNKTDDNVSIYFQYLQTSLPVWTTCMLQQMTPITSTDADLIAVEVRHVATSES